MMVVLVAVGVVVAAVAGVAAGRWYTPQRRAARDARPEAVGRMCTMIAVLGTLTVPLQDRLGDRTVLSVS